MSDLRQTARPLVSRRNFELLLLAGVLFETVHLIGLFGRRAAVDGTVLAIVFTACVPWITLLLGLAITRRGSAIAKWVLIVLVALALLAAVLSGTEAWMNDPAILIGAVAGLCQLLAVLMLFTAAGRSWVPGRNPAGRAGNQER